jgi:hypothetical protein
MLMNRFKKTLSESAFFAATSLFGKAQTKFEEMGFIQPGYRGDDRLYSVAEVEMTNCILSFLDGKRDLRTAYNMAVALLERKAA